VYSVKAALNIASKLKEVEVILEAEDMGIIMGEMSDVEIGREERGDDSRSLRGGRLVPSDYADKQTPMPFSTAERFRRQRNWLLYCMFILCNDGGVQIPTLSSLLAL
jgi:hypothetical protein